MVSADRPVADHARRGDHVLQADHDDHQVERQVDGDQPDGDADRLAESAQEHRGQQRQQDQGDQQVVVAPGFRDERVLHQVRGGVGGRQRHGDQEVGRGEAEQRQHEQLAEPAGQQPLEHGDGTLAAEALPGHPPVHRQRAEQREDTSTMVASGESRPAASAAMPGW